MSERRSTTELREKLDCKEVKIKTLDRALRTSAYVNENKEKGYESQDALEKVGDSLISLFSIKRGFELGKTTKEELHNYRDENVGNKKISEICDNLSLYEYVFWGNSQQREKEGNISEVKYADCFEAIIGVIYLDKGFEEAKRIFWEQVENLLN